MHIRSASRSLQLAVVVVVGLSLAGQADAGGNSGNTPDSNDLIRDYECFKIKDADKLKGTMAFYTPHFGQQIGECTVKKALYYCSPGRSLGTAERAGVTYTPDVYGDARGPEGFEADEFGHICYKLKCPKGKLPDALVADQFGHHTLTKVKPGLFCATAVRGCSDPSRTVLVAGSGNDSPPGLCRQFDNNQSGCETAWHVKDDGLASACGYDSNSGECHGCGGSYINDACRNNACQVCADVTRVRPSGGTCRNFDDNASGCVSAYNVGRYSTESCWYDGSSGDCRGCGPKNEITGLCSNVCRAANP